MMKIHRRTAFQRPRAGIFARKPRGFFEESNERRICRLEIHDRDNVSPADLLDADVRQTNRRPHSWFGDFHLAAVTLYRANARLEVAGLDNNSLLATQLSAGQRSRNNCADSAQGKYAIDKQARFSVVARWVHGGELAGESAFQGFNSITVANRGRDDLRICERTVAQTITNLPGDSLNSAEIAFCEGHHSSFDSEVSQNLQMLFRLLHPTVVGGNNQKREIDRADTCNHVSNKIFVTGDIDDSNLEPLLVRPDKTQLCETEIDCDLSLLFLGQPVRVGSSERFYQGAFAVIDMPRGREDEVLRCHTGIHLSRHSERSEAEWNEVEESC